MEKYQVKSKFSDEIIKNLCVRADGEIQRVTYEKQNYILKEAEEGQFELVIYKKDFYTPKYESIEQEALEGFYSDYEDIQVLKSFCGTRRFYRDENGVANRVITPGKKPATLEDFMQSQRFGNKRAIKNFFDYALTNKWEYFVTLTFRDSDIRGNQQLMSASWRSFINVLRRRSDGKVKALATYEEFEKGGYHLHAMLSDIDLNLVPARNNNKQSKDYGKFMYSEFGPQLMNCTDWNLGFNTVVCLRPDSENCNIVGYMSKYMNKRCPADFGNRRFYRTQNLTARSAFISKGDERDFGEFIENLSLELYKVDHAGNKYYRNYGIRKAEEKL